MGELLGLRTLTPFPATGRQASYGYVRFTASFASDLRSSSYSGCRDTFSCVSSVHLIQERSIMTNIGRNHLYIFKVAVAACVAATFLTLPVFVSAATGQDMARQNLTMVYEKRGDLQQLFDAATWEAMDSPRTAGLIDLETWARQYGYKEHPAMLAWYASSTVADDDGGGFDFSGVTAGAVVVVDENGKVKLAKNASRSFPLGSVTKLMTAMVVIDSGVTLDSMVALNGTDEIGGLRLRVPSGSSVSMYDLLHAMLVGSANNATMALVRGTGMSTEAFVDAMNGKAAYFGMRSTTFTEPSGLDAGNVSTAYEMSRLVRESLVYRLIRRATQTSSYSVSASDGTYAVSSPNVLLTDQDNGLYVLGGKNGYVDGAAWTVAIRMRDARNVPVVVVTVGSGSKTASFADARKVSEWVWDSVQGRSATVAAVRIRISSEERRHLRAIFDERADLQALFDPLTWKARTSVRTAGIADLEDWARQYGHKEHVELAAYGLEPIREDPPTTPPLALVVNETVLVPVKRTSATFDFSLLTASKVFVVDSASRKVLLSFNATRMHPIASITKLMTGMVIRDLGIPMSRSVSLRAQDEVGGARLRVPTGVSLTVGDLMYAMLVGSANNSAHALARSTGPVPVFVAAMNSKAGTFGLTRTRFDDPTGLSVGNESTAEEVAALAFEAFRDRTIRKMTSTATHTIWTSGGTHTITNTNGLLTDQDNGLVVLGGKTGYLNESKWNLVVHMMDARHKPIMVVVLGADTRSLSSREAERIARWVWDNYVWQ